MRVSVICKVGFRKHHLKQILSFWPSSKPLLILVRRGASIAFELCYFCKKFNYSHTLSGRYAKREARSKRNEKLSFIFFIVDPVPLPLSSTSSRVIDVA